MTNEVYRKRMVLLFSILLTCSGAVLSVGCGSPKGSQVPSGKTVQAVLQLSPATVNVSQGNDVRFTPTEDAIAISPSHCTWQAADTTILSPKGNGEFVGVGIGSSSVTATCGGSSASSSVLISSVSDPPAIRITSSGTLAAIGVAPTRKCQPLP